MRRPPYTVRWGVYDVQHTAVQGLNQKCGICGIALYDLEVEGYVSGEYIDYKTHIHGPAEFTFCSECWGRIRDNAESDMGDAIMKRKQLERKE